MVPFLNIFLTHALSSDVQFDPVIPGVLIFCMELITVQDKKFPSHKLKISESRVAAVPPGWCTHQHPKGWEAHSCPKDREGALHRGCHPSSQASHHTSGDLLPGCELHRYAFLLIYCRLILISFTRLSQQHIPGIALYSYPLVIVVIWAQSCLE